MEAIKIEHIWKTYRRGKTKRGDIRQSLNFWWQKALKGSEEFHALEDVSFTVNQGDVVGIIGPNGAGKSTLLKLLSRITFPSRGRISIHGSLSSLLEVGIGFHPELTGRDNIYLNGAIHGMSRRDLDLKFDEIVTFSGLEDSLDTPVKQYSSGMYVRLAFSVSAHLDSDILLLDEVLGVGDYEFKKKSLNKLYETVQQGRTIIMVSHQVELLETLCTKGVYLEHGRVRQLGSIDEVIKTYLSGYQDSLQKSLSDRMDREGNGLARFSSIEIIDENGQPLPHVVSGQSVMIRIQVASKLPVLENVEIRLDVFDKMGQQWFVLSNNVSNGMIGRCEGNAIFQCSIPKFPLAAGSYYLNASLNVLKQPTDSIQNAVQLEVVPGNFYTTGRTPGSGKGVLIDYDWKILGHP